MDYKIIILAVVITIVLIVGTQVWKQSILKKLLKHMQQGDFNAYFKLLDSLPCKYFYPPFNREYMRLNGYIMKADKKKIEECFELILSMRMNKKQELDVVIKAFYYYLDEDSKKKCKTLLERMKKIADESITQECQVIYDILLEEKTSYIDDMLALQYSYLKDEKKKKEHLQAASKDLKGTPYEMKINQLMKK